MTINLSKDAIKVCGGIISMIGIIGISISAGVAPLLYLYKTSSNFTLLTIIGSICVLAVYFSTTLIYKESTGLFLGNMLRAIFFSAFMTTAGIGSSLARRASWPTRAESIILVAGIAVVVVIGFLQKSKRTRDIRRFLNG